MSNSDGENSPTGGLETEFWNQQAHGFDPHQATMPAYTDLGDTYTGQPAGPLPQQQVPPTPAAGQQQAQNPYNNAQNQFVPIPEFNMNALKELTTGIMAASAEQTKALIENMKESHKKEMQGMMEKMAKQAKDEKDLHVQQTTAIVDTLKETSKDNRPNKNYNVMNLSKREDYHLWVYKLNSLLDESKIRAWVDVQMNLKPGDPIPVDDRTDKQKQTVIDMGASVVKCLQGDALKYCQSRAASGLIETLKVLFGWAGVLSPVEQSIVKSEFDSGKWDSKKEDLQMWIAGKFALVLRIEKLVPKSTVEDNMRLAILNNLPEHFAGLANELRANPPENWQAIASRLEDFDKARSQRPEQEQQAKTFATELKTANEKVTKMQKQIGSLEKKNKDLTNLYTSGGKGGGKHGGKANRPNGGGYDRYQRPVPCNQNRQGTGSQSGDCWYCHKQGHHAHECWDNPQSSNCRGNKGRGKQSKGGKRGRRGGRN